MAKKSKRPTGWRWTNTESTIAYTGARDFSVAIDEIERDGKTLYVASVIHDAPDPSSDDRVEELGAFSKFSAADEVGQAYVSRRSGEPMPPYERFDPTAPD